MAGDGVDYAEEQDPPPFNLHLAKVGTGNLAQLIDRRI